MSKRTRCAVVTVCVMAAGLSMSRAEIASDVLTATDMVRQTGVGGTNYFMANVGMGTAEPASPLHVIGQADFEGGMSVSGALQVARQGDIGMGIFTNGVSGSGISGALPAGTLGYLMYYNGTQWTAMTNMYVDGANQRVYFNAGEDGTYVSAATGALTMGGNIVLNGKWLSGDGDNEGIYVDDAGRVGVGTATPAAILHATAGDGAALRVDAAYTGKWTTANMDLRADGATRARIRGQKAGDDANKGTLMFCTANASGQLREHVRIDDVGALRVDINTVSTDSNGIYWHVGNGSSAYYRYVYQDIADGYFRVRALDTNTWGEVTLARVNKTSGWEAGCSAELKRDIVEVGTARMDAIRTDFKALKVYTYERKDDPGRAEIGVIAETTSPWIKGSSDDAVSPLRWLGYLTAVVKDQQAQLDQLRLEIEALKSGKP